MLHSKRSLLDQPAPPLLPCEYGLGDSHPRPMRISVLVTLERHAEAGGHVKCWEKFAAAAALYPDSVDLAVHFLGESTSVAQISNNVRFVHHAPRFSTRRIPFLHNDAGHTDLSHHHPGVFAALSDADVVHTTDSFSLGRTGRSFSRQTDCALVASIHTDLPKFTYVYADEILRRTLGPVGRSLGAPWQLPALLARRAEAKLARHLRACDLVLISKDEDEAAWTRRLTRTRVARLRRGIDTHVFSPRHRDRRWLAHVHGIEQGLPVLFYAGRIDSGKNVLVLAQAAAAIISRGIDLRVILAGTGGEVAKVQSLLGERAICLGHLDQASLARYYANADVFVFPSTTEVAPNVVLEAKASGLPVLAATADGGGQYVVDGKDGYSLPSTAPEIWADRLVTLLANREQLGAFGRAARLWAETAWPSWSTVFAEDLLPAWRHAIDRRRLRYSAATECRPSR